MMSLKDSLVSTMLYNLCQIFLVVLNLFFKSIWVHEYISQSNTAAISYESLNWTLYSVLI